MNQAATPREKSTDMNETNVRQFLDAARQYLLGLMPAQPAPAVAPIVARGLR
jgi:hypothetical protein